MAGELGYSFTLDEAKQYALSKTSHSLTDEQLDAIAGGSDTSEHVQTTVQTATAAAQAGVAVVAAAVVIVGVI